MVGVAQTDTTTREERIEAVQLATAEITTRFDRAYWRQCIDQDRQPLELMAALAESGLLGIGLPEGVGGSGGGLTDEAALVEALGHAGVPSSSFLIANFCRDMVYRWGTEAQWASFLPRTLSGEIATCFAITEADAGTNSFAMRTRAAKVDGGWRITGQKTFISAVGDARQMLMVARTDEATDADRTFGLSMFIVELPARGITLIPLDIQTFRPEHQWTVFFDDVVVPDEALVGKRGNAVRSMFSALNPERILASAQSVGLGRYLLTKGAEYATTRAPFGAPIGQYQAVQHPLARAYADLEAARLVTYKAAAEVDAGEAGGISANTAKLLSSEAAYAAYEATVQAHGGSAFDRDVDLLSFYEAIRIARIAPINNEQILNFIAERALGLPKSY